MSTEQLRTAELAMTRAVLRAASSDDALLGLLHAACSELGYDAGVAWRAHARTGVLECVAPWFGGEDEPTEAARIGALAALASASLREQVRTSGTARFSADLSVDAVPAARALLREGLRSVVAFPLQHGGATVGVIELWSRVPRSPAPDLVAVLSGLGQDVGRFLETKRAEDDLRQSEGNLRDFFENAAVALHWVDPNGIIVRANRAELELLGYSEEEYLGRSIADFHVDSLVVEAILARLRCGDTIENQDARLRARDGSIRDVLISSNGLWDGDRFVHSRCFTRDVTARKRSERRLHEQTAMLRSLAAATPDLIFVKDRAGRLLFGNPALFALIGAEKTVLGRTDTEFHPDAEHARAILENDRRIMASGQAEVIEENFGADGAVTTFLSTKAPYRNEDGEVVGLVGIARDITERKRLELELQRSERLYRSIGESIDYGVWICDESGRNRYASESFLQLVGLTQQHCSDFGWSTRLRADDVEKTLAEWKECVRTEALWDRELCFIGADGELHALLARWVPVRAAGGPILGWAGINLDIRRLKEAEDRLREADQRKDEFLATLAHELRNPLAPIANAVQLLLSPGSTELDRAGCGPLIERQVQHLTRLIDDLLDVARITRDQVELRRERVELDAVVEMAVETSRPWIEASKHRLDVSLPQRAAMIDADPLRLAQVVSNLLNNAAKYTPIGGRIALSAETAGEEVVIRVRDDGIGIAPDSTSRIFEMFRRGDGRRDLPASGLGLGLNLVQRFVEMHGGTVRASSPGIGQGSEFVVTLPVVVPASTGDTEPAPGERGGGPPRPRRILVVDDSVDSADSLGLLLRRENHDVRIAYHGLEAVDVASAFAPEVVLLDIGLPDMDGIEVAKRLRALPEGHRTLIIALTGWSEEAARRRTEAAGFDHHLAKPVDLPTLRRLLDAASG